MASRADATLTLDLQTHAHAASRAGDWESARYVLGHLADRRGWCDETLRARWDGAAALLTWWHALDPVARPPLDDLKPDDARAFLADLAAQGLARSTVRGYRAGAAALSGALRACRGWPVGFDGDYAPFSGVTVPRGTRPSQRAEDASMLAKALPPLPKARLELLLALMELGMSLPEACSRRWLDVNLSDRLIVGYRGRCLRYGADVVTALEALLALRLRRHGGQRLLGWTADTARRWLYRNRTDRPA